VNWLLGRRLRDWRKPLLFFLGAVAVASAALGFIGQRGQGEQEGLRTVSYARPLEKGVWDVTQWSLLFVTHSGTFNFSHAGAFNLYSDLAEPDDTGGAIEDGAPGNCSLNVPLFSSRTLVHRARMTGAELELSASGWSGGTLDTHDFKVTGKVPEDFVCAWAATGTLAHGLKRQGETLVCDGTALNVNDDEPYFGRQYAPDYDGKLQPAEAARPLIRRALGMDMGNNPPKMRPVPPGCLYLFVMTSDPKAFQDVSGSVKGVTGYVIYRLTFNSSEQ